MKKVLATLLIGFIFNPLAYKASNDYSEWSIEYPTIDNVNIKTEQRYLYYMMEEANVEYKKYDPYCTKEVDFNDYKYQFSYSTYDEVQPNEHIRVSTIETQVEKAYNDVKYIKIKNNGYEEKELELLGISFQDSRTMRNVRFSLLDMKDAIKEEENENSFIIDKDGYIIFSLDEAFIAGQFLQINFILMGHNTSRTKDFMVDYMDSNGNVNFTVQLQSYVGRNIAFNTYPDDKILWVSRVDVDKIIEYVVEDKLYKYYDLVRTDLGYYTYLEGEYLKDEVPVTFYSYQIIDEIEPLNQIDETLEEEEDDRETSDSQNDTSDNHLNESILQEDEQNEQEHAIEEGCELEEDLTDEQNDILNESDNKNQKNNKLKTSKKNGIIEPTYEYLESYPLNIDDNDNIDEYSLYQNEEIENLSNDLNTGDLIAFKTDGKKNNEVYKIYSILSLSGILVLLLIILIYKALKKKKNI